ncbi:hypothetical protein FS837_000453 [Tulasnella sp. UAMH 9824]|nr:hypothetical protein FS837_000453 [Tulasnella sp. UAMH 9824]
MDSEASEAALQSTLKQLAYLRIESSRLTIENDSEVGNGGFGDVYIATLDGSSRVAVKQLRIIRATGTQVRVAMYLTVSSLPLTSRQRLARELQTWSKAQHPNVLKLVGFYLSKNYDCAQLVSPYLPNGNITEYIKRKKPSTDARLGFANVLINDKLEAVLCDFGLATFVQNSGPEYKSGLTTSLTIKGSTRYMSPELFQTDEAKHTLESDVWAWACTVFEIITDSVPYPKLQGVGNIILALTCGTPPGSLALLKSPAFDVDMPLRSTLDCLRHLVPECWSSNPNKRPSFSIIHDRIERGLGNPASGLSREESPQQPRLTQENIPTYFHDLLSLDTGNPSILGSFTGAPPAGNTRKATAQPEALPTTPSASPAHHETLIDFSFDFPDQSNSSISQSTAVATEQATSATEHPDQGSILTPQQSGSHITYKDDLEALLFDMDGENGAPAFTPLLHQGRAIDTPPTEHVKQDRSPITNPDVKITSKMDGSPNIRETRILPPTAPTRELPDILSGSRGSSPPNHGSPPSPKSTPAVPQPGSCSDSRYNGITRDFNNGLLSHAAPDTSPTNLPPSSRKPVYEVPTAKNHDTPTDSESMGDLSTHNVASVTTPKTRRSVKRPVTVPPPPTKINEAPVPPSSDLEHGPRDAAPKRTHSRRNPPSNSSSVPAPKDPNPRLDHQVAADKNNPSTVNGAPVAGPGALPSVKPSANAPRPGPEVIVAPAEPPIIPPPDVELGPHAATRKPAHSSRNPSSNGDSYLHPGHPTPPAPTHPPNHPRARSPVPVTRSPPEIPTRSGTNQGTDNMLGSRPNTSEPSPKKGWFRSLFCC